MKKFGYFILGIAAIGFLLFLWWFLGKRGLVTPPPFDFSKNPFGFFDDVGNPDNTIIPGSENQTSTSTEQPAITSAPPVFKKLWADPVGGFTFIERAVATTSLVGTSSRRIFSTTTFIRFVDRATGHVYEAETKELKPYKLTNSTVPGVYDAFFFMNGNAVLMRYPRNDGESITTIVANIPDSTRPLVTPLSKIKTLPNNITSVTVSSNNNDVAFVEKTTEGSRLYTIPRGTTTPRLISENPFSSWRPIYNDSILYLSKKASTFEKGGIFTTALDYLGANKTGQSVVFSTKQGGAFFSSMSSDDGLVSFLGSLQSSSITKLSLQTLAEKCAWAYSGTFILCGVPSFIPDLSYGLPDDWYRGEVSFSDGVYSITTTEITEKKLASLEEETGEVIDLIKPAFTRDSYGFAFINRKDGALWFADSSQLLTR